MQREWKGRCHHCWKESGSYIMSMYNEDLICMECKSKETGRPDYKQAESRDLTAYAVRLRGLGMGPQADNVEKLAKELLEGK
jgi:hypothetical protein